MRTAELLSLQRKFGLPAEALPDVCFEWPLRTLVEEEVVAAIRAALDNPQAAVDVVEISAFPAPEGRIEFQKSQLLPQPADAARTAVLWRGDVVYGRGRRFSIWARVRLRVPCTRAVAMEALRPGQSIRSEQVRVEAGECFPTEVSASDQVAGMRVKRFIAAGAAVPHSALEPVYDVNRGDKVAVEVRCGAARLAFTAQAETGGAAGDEVTLRNPDSKRTFRAQVEGPGRAVVTIPTSGDN
jgi:flagella basal body P-ring formation protein FlgA